MRLSASLLLVFAAALSAAPVAAQSPSTVLVVANASSPRSIALANYYTSARQIPARNRLLVRWSPADSADTITRAAYQSLIATPVYAKIATLQQIDYIVLCRNLPSKIAGYGSVDSALAGNIARGPRLNPYFWRSEPFSSRKFGIYLVTRLDGWSWEDARSLVDRSIAASSGGTILLDMDPAKRGGFLRFNNLLRLTPSRVSDRSVHVILTSSPTFARPRSVLAGYASWGSNDSHFNSSVWKSIRFDPGAIAETAVSTSAMYLRTPPAGGQSQIAQLIRDGVTGVKGYVAEPFLTAIADPSTLFGRYTSGRNLAESFYAASMYVCWKDVVIGDPLCAPYR